MTSSGLVNPASYITNTDGTATDNVTGLTWAATASSAETPAQTAAASVTGSWRLPTVLELVSLVDFTVTPGPTGSHRLASSMFLVRHPASSRPHRRTWRPPAKFGVLTSATPPFPTHRRPMCAVFAMPL